MAALSSGQPPPPPLQPPPPNETRRIVCRAVHSTLIRLCGGGVIGRTDTATAPACVAPAGAGLMTDSCCSSPRTASGSGAELLTEWHQALYDLAAKSVSFTNGGKAEDSANDGGGKPHDVEVRAALSLFHKYKRRTKATINASKDDPQGRKRTRDDHDDGSAEVPLQIVSDLGLRRPLNSAGDLAQLMALDMEEHLAGDAIAMNGGEAAGDGNNASGGLGVICDDIRPASTSGILCLTTKHRVQQLRHSGKLPCPLCIKWCNGEKGLWWHRQVEHGADHGNAMEDASKAADTLAMVVYDPALAAATIHSINASTVPNEIKKNVSSCDENYRRNDPFECAKSGDLENLMRSSQGEGLDLAAAIDSNGSTCLHWAAGGGHLDVVKYLIETLGCCPDIGQEGKRSFRDRTPLHWASRNGHLNVVRYLLEKCNASIEAATVDGTTAFCWASWQGHLEVMTYLHSRGCNVHTINSFGCNATLWAAQGEGELEAMKWLCDDIGCDFTRINENGHSILHKSAQRGKRAVIQWVLERMKGQTHKAFELIGPDLERHCPSDLAGMEGHAELAEWLSDEEKDLAAQWYKNVASELPEWIAEGLQQVDVMSKLIVGSKTQMNAWEAGGGTRRICCHIVNDL